jgi:2-polyprenyl-3-methyl-5-hydroxy-6-metoxy-1,4-benzoquinol methylase
MDKDTQKKLINLVSESYDNIAKEYSDTRKKYHTPLFDALTVFTSEIKDGKNVLDVGCGSGRLISIFGDKKINYLGVDKSLELISFAKTNYPNNKFEVGDLLELSQLAEINFDYVFCAAVLHHLPGQDLRIAALKQLKNKISENGKIIITTWNMWHQKKFTKLIRKYFLLRLIGKNKMDFGDILFDWKNSAGEAIGQRYYHAFTKCQLRRIAQKAGLKIEKLYKDRYNYYLILSK